MGKRVRDRKEAAARKVRQVRCGRIFPMLTAYRQPSMSTSNGGGFDGWAAPLAMASARSGRRVLARVVRETRLVWRLKETGLPVITRS
jgi:hypothetical protein